MPFTQRPGVGVFCQLHSEVRWLSSHSHLYSHSQRWWCMHTAHPKGSLGLEEFMLFRFRLLKVDSYLLTASTCVYARVRCIVHSHGADFYARIRAYLRPRVDASSNKIHLRGSSPRLPDKTVSKWRKQASWRPTTSMTRMRWLRWSENTSFCMWLPGQIIKTRIRNIMHGKRQGNN